MFKRQTIEGSRVGWKTRGPASSWLQRTAAGLALAGLVLLFLAGCGQPNIKVEGRVEYPAVGPSFVPVDYRIGPGDQLEVLYQIDPHYKIASYVIDTEDTLRVDFFYYPVMSRTVRVRPDGYITLPKVGDVKAVGLRPEVLARELYKTYSPHLTRPDITVEVVGFNAKLEELKKAITTLDRGQSRLVVVRPDGMISLPYLADVKAAGFTPGNLSHALQQRYQRIMGSINVTVAVLDAQSYQVYVMGEVQRPNFYKLPGPTTLSQAVARAGGFANYADTHQIVLISRNEKDQPVGQVVDMDAIVGQANIGADPILRQYDVVYVPRTTMGKLSLVGEALWQLIPLQFVMNGTYSLGGAAAK